MNPFSHLAVVPRQVATVVELASRFDGRTNRLEIDRIEVRPERERRITVRAALPGELRDESAVIRIPADASHDTERRLL